MKKNKILLLGLDGATWDLIKPWVKKGKLPTFKKLIENGTHGDLESTIPHVTPPAWTSINTGKNPGKHGIFDFTSVEIQNVELRYKLYSSKTKKTQELWEMLDGYSIIVNVPLTYPPKKLNGIMVTGMYTPDNSNNFTYPDDIKNEILNIIPEYKTELNWSKYKNKKNLFIKDLYSMTEARMKLFWHFYRKNWNFYYFVLVGTDRIQHIIWNDGELLKYYKFIDNKLKELINEIKNKNITLMIVSDHGFSKIKKIFHVNTLLYNLGYLKSKHTSNQKEIRERKISKETLAPILINLKLISIYQKFPKTIKNIIRKIIPGGTNLEYDFDFMSSQAIMVGSGGIFVNKKNTQKKDILLEEIINKLKNVKNPKTNEVVIQDVFKKNQIYSGDFLHEAPDLIILPKKGYSLSSSLTKDVFEEPLLKKADHALNGIFIAYGPNIKEGLEINAKVYDIAPTILYMNSIPIPEDLDGKILENIFKNISEYDLSKHHFSNKNIYENEIKKKIKNLKKLGKI